MNCYIVARAEDFTLGIVMLNDVMYLANHSIEKTFPWFRVFTDAR